MSQIGVAKFIAAVGLHFPRPKFNEDETSETAWMASMVRCLGGYDDEVLEEAAGRIIATRNPKRDGKFFPVPSECTAFCEQACRALNMAATPLLEKPKSDEWSPDRKKLADDLVSGELGKRAVREGWLGMLHVFCRRHARLPTSEHEIAECRREAVAFNRAYEDCKNGNGGEAGEQLVELGESMMKRRQELVGKVA